jgi:hypothetical protein
MIGRRERAARAAAGEGKDEEDEDTPPAESCPICLEVLSHSQIYTKHT